MAMVCKTGARECDGCMRCEKEAKPLICPHCGQVLEHGEKVYKQEGWILGCEYCIEVRDAEDELDDD